VNLADVVPAKNFADIFLGKFNHKFARNFTIKTKRNAHGSVPSLVICNMLYWLKTDEIGTSPGEPN
jgi:hypothetical protein